MVKFLKPGKVVVLLQGRYAGKKAVIIKPFDEGVSNRKYGHALVCSLSKTPRRVLKSKSKKKQKRAKNMKTFIKYVNYQHMMPTRYSLDVDLKPVVSPESFEKEGVTKRLAARKNARKLLEECFEKGKSKWFFTKLRF